MARKNIAALSAAAAGMLVVLSWAQWQGKVVVLWWAQR